MIDPTTSVDGKDQERLGSVRRGKPLSDKQLDWQLEIIMHALRMRKAKEKLTQHVSRLATV